MENTDGPIGPRVSAPAATVPYMTENPWRRPPVGSESPTAAGAGPATVGARTVAEVAAVRDNIAYAGSRGFQPDFGRGIYAACLWALGEAPGPLTGRAAHAVPDTAQLHEESAAADRQLQFPDDRARPRDYVNGVQHAVMWISGESDTQPWPMWQTR